MGARALGVPASRRDGVDLPRNLYQTPAPVAPGHSSHVARTDTRRANRGRVGQGW